MAKIRVPRFLYLPAASERESQLRGNTVGEALEALCQQFPDLRKQLFNDEGKLRSFVNVYLNDEDIRYLDKLNTRVTDDDQISIVPSIAGGPGSNIEIQGALHRD